MAVWAVLFVDRVVGVGDNEIRAGEHFLLGVDPAVYVVGLVDLLVAHACAQEALTFVTTEGVAGMDQRHAEQVRQAHTAVTGIGVSAMNQVRHPALLV